MASWKRLHLSWVLKDEWIVGVIRRSKALPAMIHVGVHSMSEEGQMLGDEADRSTLKDTIKKTTGSQIQKGTGCHTVEFFSVV